MTSWKKNTVEDACCIWKRLISKRISCSKGHTTAWIYIQIYTWIFPLRPPIGLVATPLCQTHLRLSNTRGYYMYILNIKYKYMTINYYVGKRHFPIIQPIFTLIFPSKGLTKRSKVAIDPKVNAREIGKSKRSSNKLTRVASNLGAIWGI